jgi:hypothetical protein
MCTKAKAGHLKKSAKHHFCLHAGKGAPHLTLFSLQGAYRDSLACTTHRWIAFLGETIMFAAIIAKTYRLWKIFHNPSLQRYAVRTLTIGVGENAAQSPKQN